MAMYVTAVPIIQRELKPVGSVQKGCTLTGSYKPRRGVRLRKTVMTLNIKGLQNLKKAVVANSEEEKIDNSRYLLNKAKRNDRRKEKYRLKMMAKASVKAVQGQLNSSPSKAVPENTPVYDFWKIIKPGKYKWLGYLESMSMYTVLETARQLEADECTRTVPTTSAWDTIIVYKKTNDSG
jgi:hypothetical protein